jgi:NAD-dependent DNA ligase
MKININTAKQQQDEAKARIAELQQKLRDTDFKILADYRDRSGMTDADYDEIVNQRKSWYDELKSLEPMV